MSNNVFANNFEVSCKAAAGMTIAALPDTCFTPPECPATPPGVPIPYPNTGKASDTTKGTKTVKISKKEVGIKNVSHFKTSYGDEAGCAAKKGIITSKNKGKVYFQAWSSDVKFEGKNAVRHFDITTNNHMSNPGDTPPWPYLDTLTAGSVNPCEKEQEEEQKACGPLMVKKPNGSFDKAASKTNACDAKSNQAKKCRKARKCKLTPYSEGCCNNLGVTPHHIVESHNFVKSGKNGAGKTHRSVASSGDLTAAADSLIPDFQPSNTGLPKQYRPQEAPCVCAQGERDQGEHGAFHGMVGKRENAAVAAATKAGSDPTRAWTYKQAKQAGCQAHNKIFPKSKCSKACLAAQVDEYHNSIGASDSSPIRTGTQGMADWQKKSDREILKTLQEHRRAFKRVPGIPTGYRQVVGAVRAALPG